MKRVTIFGRFFISLVMGLSLMHQCCLNAMEPNSLVNNDEITHSVKAVRRRKRDQIPDFNSQAFYGQSSNEFALKCVCFGVSFALLSALASLNYYIHHTE